MTSLLEQAIIDADSLRSAALKTAETTILERYSNEVRSGVESILEQEMMPPMGPEDEEEAGLEGLPPEEAFGAGMAIGPEEDAPEFGIPMGAAEEQPLCPCPDEKADLEIEFKLGDLLAAQEEMTPGEPFAQEELAMGMGAEQGPPGVAPSPMGAGEEEEEEGLLGMIAEEIRAMSLEEDEDMDLSEIVEEVVYDTEARPTGWASHPGDSVPDATKEYETDLGLAGQVSEEDAPAEEDPEKEVLELRLAEAVKRLRAYERESHELVEANEQMKTLFMQMKGKLDEVNLSNAKLLYTNRTLNSASLNERQKSKIVDSIRKADTIEEAKVIYETLQSAVGPSKKEGPKSLREAIRRPSMTMPRRRSENSKHDDIVKRRFQRLAGIK